MSDIKEKLCGIYRQYGETRRRDAASLSFRRRASQKHGTVAISSSNTVASSPATVAKPVALAIAVAIASRFGGGPGWTQSPRIAVVSRRDGVCACRVVMVLSPWRMPP